MTWLEPNTAPMGELETRKKTITKGKEKGKKHIYETWVAPRILGCANGWSTETYWIPPEGKKQGRWHKFNEGTELDGWMPMPKAIGA